MATTTRKVLTATAIAAAVTGLSLTTAGTASATTLQADSCTAPVRGQIGDQVAVAGSSLKGLVEAGAKEAQRIIIVDHISIWPGHLANEIGKQGAIGVGNVPNAASGKVDGNAVGEAVVQRLRGSAGLGFNPEKTLGIIKNKVAGNCGLTVFAANYNPPSGKTTPPAQDGSQSPAPGGTGSVPSTGNAGYPSGGTGTAPRRDYSNIPAATPGVATPPGLRYPPAPNAVPGQGTPEFGILGADTAREPGQPDVRNAGNADALAAQPGPSSVQLPMLLAVVALAGVTAALVRTWVLRKVS